MTSTRRMRGLAGLVGLALVASACGSDPLGASLDLADLGRCPDPIVIQTAGVPSPEHGALYQLTAGDGRIDPAAGRFSGPLAADPTRTVEIRTGGPYLGELTVARVMSRDPDILLGQIDTDEAIASYRFQPTTAVVAPLDISPRILLWDPDTHPIETWSDVATTQATVSHAPGALYVEFLAQTDVVDRSQLEPTWDGSPDRFLNAGGELIQQGSAAREPYDYERVLVDWGRAVDWLLVHDTGWEPYPASLAVLDERLDAGVRSCLAALVPLIQRAAVDYQRDPTATNDLLLDVSAELRSLGDDEVGELAALTPDGVADSVVQMGSLGLVGNGGNGTIGDFDVDRVAVLLATVRERLPTVEVPSGLQPDDLVSNDFIDPDIGL